MVGIAHFEIFTRQSIKRPANLAFGNEAVSVSESVVTESWYWHLRAANGEIIAQSEGYTREDDARRAIAAVRRAVADAPDEIRVKL